MAPTDLQNALKLSQSVENVWTARADPNYESANGMFGGWTTAVALRAVCDDADGDAMPAAITLNFVDRIEPGTEVCIRTRRIGGGRSVSYWQSEVTTLDNDATLATASVVLATRRDSDGHLEITMPEVPDPATLEATCGCRILVRAC